MVITQISRKKLGGHHACLGDIVRIIAKMAWGKFYKSWLKSNKFQFFRLILPIVNLTVSGFFHGKLKPLKNYNFTFMRRRAAHCKTVE